MSDLNNSSDYWREINSIALTLWEETFAETDETDELDTRLETAEEIIHDSRLHETIDGHQWVIYSRYNLDVIRYSDNADYYVDNFGGDALAESAKSGIDTLHCHIAFWCMYADVCDVLDQAKAEFIDSLETA